MAQDHTQWDVFADAAKFQRREEILEKRRKAKIQAEMQVLRSDREFKVELADQERLKDQIARLQEKVAAKELQLAKKGDRENELQEIIKKKEKLIKKKQDEITELSNSAYQFEVMQEKFVQKEIELAGLLDRLGEMATENEGLQNDVRLYDQKLVKKSKYIDELKERNRHLKEENEELASTHERNTQRFERQIALLQEQRDELI